MSCDLPLTRRAVVASLFVLGACGFAPALAPGGSAMALDNRVAVTVPDTIPGFALRARLLDRLGRGGSELRLVIDIEQALETAAQSRTGDTLRYNLIGAAGYVLTDAQDIVLGQGQVDGFTSYAATGSTVSTQTSATDAQARLMILLADRILAELNLLDLSS